MERRRLPPYAVEAYDIIREAATWINDDHREIAPDAARTVLETADEEFITGDIEHVLDLLYNRGEIYHVDGQIRFTTPDEFDEKHHDTDSDDSDD